MSLDWRLPDDESKGQPGCFWKETGENDSDGKPLYRLHAHTEYLIWSTMAIDMGEITEDTWEEFYSRMHRLELVRGPNVFRYNEDNTRTVFWTTPAVVRAHMGLNTNVSTVKDKKWSERLMGMMTDDAKRNITSALETDAELEKEAQDRRPDKITWFLASTPGRNHVSYRTATQSKYELRSDSWCEGIFLTTFWDKKPELIPDAFNFRECDENECICQEENCPFNKIGMEGEE